MSYSSSPGRGGSLPSRSSTSRKRALSAREDLHREAAARAGGGQYSGRRDTALPQEDDPLHLIVEIKGYRREDAKEKKAALENYWVPGVNNHGRYGRWAFVEFNDWRSSID